MPVTDGAAFVAFDMKMVKFTAIAFGALFGALLLLLVVGAPADFLTDTIRTRFAAETGHQLKIGGGVKIGIWPAPSIVLDDVSLIKSVDDTVPDVTAASARLQVSLASLLQGRPKIAEFALVRPVVRVPLLWRADQRADARAEPDAADTATRQGFDIGHVVVEDGSVVFVLPDGRIHRRVDHIKVVAALTDPDRRLDAKIEAMLDDQSLRIQINSKAPIDGRAKVLPLEFSIEAPGLLEGTLSSTANVSTVGTLVKINDLDGAIGKDRFVGWASVDMASKPRVKVDVNFQRLSLAATAPNSNDVARPSTIDQPWSDQAFDIADLNFVDADVRFSATEFAVSRLRLAPVYVEATLADSVLNLKVSNTGLYGGTGDAAVNLDVSSAVPKILISTNLSGVRAAPFLSALVDFRAIDGKLQGKIDVRTGGESPRAVMSALNGTADVHFQDGEIRGVNLAKTVRSLTQGILNGWQEEKSEKTDLSALSALFKIDSGRAMTDNLKLVSPLMRVNGTGTADIAAKTLQLKLDTKLVLSFEGQGGAADPVGFGVPVIVEGKWGAPKIYPDITGILDNPDAAYAKLRDLGAGLFGNKNGSGSAATGSDTILKALGNLFGPKSSDGKDNQAPPAGDKPPQETQTGVGDFLKNLFGR